MTDRLRLMQCAMTDQAPKKSRERRKLKGKSLLKVRIVVVERGWVVTLRAPTVEEGGLLSVPIATLHNRVVVGSHRNKATCAKPCPKEFPSWGARYQKFPYLLIDWCTVP